MIILDGVFGPDAKRYYLRLRGPALTALTVVN